MRRFTFKVPKKSILLAVAVVLAGGIYGFVQEFREGGEPSADAYRRNCTKTCIPTAGESESGREFCDCVCGGIVEDYPLDELEAFESEAETSQDPASLAYSKFRDVYDRCIARWEGPEYPSNFRQTFLGECSRVAGEGFQDYCECVLGQVERQYSLSEYMEIELKVQQDPAYQPPGLATAVAACSH